MSESTFHPLADDDTTYPEMGDGKALVANSSQDKKMVAKNTTEAPCESEDGRPMKADSFHHRGK